VFATKNIPNPIKVIADKMIANFFSLNLLGKYPKIKLTNENIMVLFAKYENMNSSPLDELNFTPSVITQTIS
jgi:hypothetical protein